MPTVTPDTQTDQDLDLFLILILESFEAPHCESGHSDPRNRECSHTPVAVGHVACNGDSRLSCQKQVNWINRALELSITCIQCKRPVQDCWYVTSLPASL